MNRLAFDAFGTGTEPEVRMTGSNWVWQREGLRVGGRSYPNGVTVRGSSSVTIELNRACTTYDALVGVDDMMLGLGRVRFSVYGDGARLWRSPVIGAGEPALPVRVGIGGRRTVRLVVEPEDPLLDGEVLADWAQSRLTCGQ